MENPPVDRDSSEQLYLNKRTRARSIPTVTRLAGQIIPLVMWLRHSVQSRAEALLVIKNNNLREKVHTD